MSVTTISSSSSSQAVNKATAATAVRAVAAIPKSRSSRPPARISKEAQSLQQLKSLQEADPEKLKKVAADVSQKLKAEADEQGGEAGKMLSQLADKFDAVARSGEVADLKSSGKPSAGQGSAPATGAEAYSQNAQRAAVKADVDQIVANAMKGLA